MEIKYGLISCDSHAQVDRDAFTSRMSKAKWGDAIPHLMETEDKEHMAVAMDRKVERWVVHGELVGNRGACNSPAVMDDPMRKYFPQRWDEVPKTVYDPAERLKALDQDGIDAEVLFPNDPVQGTTFFQGMPLSSSIACGRITTPWLNGARSVTATFPGNHSIPQWYRCDREGSERHQKRPQRHRHGGRAEPHPAGSQAL